MTHKAEDRRAARVNTATEKRSLPSRVGDLVWRSDTTATRFSLALCAAMLAISSWTGGTDCQYIGCVYLELVAPWRWWATGWLIYAVLMGWRVFEGRNRPRIAIVVNILGALLFCASAIVLVASRWPFTTLSAASVTLAAASLWIVMRTAINQGDGFRGD